MPKTVYVGMSGGVDSSVAAALLVEQGYRVVGVFMKNWTQGVAGYQCPWRDDLIDAQSVAAKLNIPLKIFDFEKEYKRLVVDYMVSEFKMGNTPNPDIICNQEVKFKLFLNTALRDGADLIATGHYAKVSQFAIRNSQFEYRLLRGKDSDKDQSYFLYRITQEALSKTLMPIGELIKPEVRKIAHKLDLATAGKPDSQGICFIGEVDIKDFLQQYIKPKSGSIKTSNRKIIGRHDGLAFYTIGQRHGLNIGGGEPYYVVNKDIKTNTLIVTANPYDPDLRRTSFIIANSHWINNEPDFKKDFQVVTRYRGKATNALLKKSGKDIVISFKTPERAITPGQSAVVYDGDQVLGGGVITT